MSPNVLEMQLSCSVHDKTERYKILHMGMDYMAETQTQTGRVLAERLHHGEKGNGSLVGINTLAPPIYLKTYS